MGPGTRIRKVFIKTLKYTGIGIAALLALMFLLPYLFPGFVSNKIKQWANQSIDAQLDFSRVRLSFFNHFPSLTLTLYDVSLTGSEPFRQDTLVAGKEIALGVNLASLFSKTIRINEIYLTRSRLHILVDEQGRPNYNIYTGATEKADSPAPDTSAAALRLDRIQIDECSLVYDDRSIPISLRANRLDYLGKGDLSKAIFDLSSRIRIEGFSLRYDGQDYLVDKKLNAKLVTRINTHSLALVFQENKLRINQLPVQFKGSFDFLKDGYRLNFALNTPSTDFSNLFTALPPAAVTWLDRASVKGKVEMSASLQGDYIAASHTAPDINFAINISNGAIKAHTMQERVEDIHLGFRFVLPALDMEKIQVNIDTLHARLGQDRVSAAIEERGFLKPFIKGHIAANADLGKWYQALAIDSSIALRGVLAMKGFFNGIIDMSSKQLPVTDLSISLSDGYLKTPYYPEPLSNLQVSAALLNNKGTTDDFRLQIHPLSLRFAGQDFTLTTKLDNLDNLAYKLESKGVLDVGKLYKLVAIEGYDIRGRIKTAISLEGTQADAMAKRFDKLHNSGTFELENIRLRSRSFPKPFIVQSGAFHVKDDRLVADKLLMKYGNTNVSLNGYMQHIIGYALKNGSSLQGKFSMQTPCLFVDELMAFAPADSTIAVKDTMTATGVVMIPRDIDMEFRVGADKILYNGLQLDEFVSATAVRDGKLSIRNAGFRMIDARVNMNASYTSLNERRASFSYQINAEDFDIQKAYKEIKLFREMASAAGKAHGTVSLNYELSGMLDENMYPVLPSLKGGGTLSLKKIKVYGLKLFSAISKTTGREKVNDPDLSKVDIKTKVARNIITIERLKLRIAGFRPRFEGQVSLDGRLNLQARLGLPPFGIFGIPFHVSGTQEKPIVKLRRARASDKLAEASEEDEDADDEDRREAAEAAATEQKKVADIPSQH